MPIETLKDAAARRRTSWASGALIRRARSSPTRFASDTRPPVILLGGSANALSIARRLSRIQVPVFSINKADAPICYSRCATSIRMPEGPHYAQHWTDYLLGPASDGLSGAVLLAASDVGLRIVAQHRETLRRKFRLDASEPVAQLTMLDKAATYQAASEAGVPTPRFWIVRDRHELEAVQAELVYPLLVKPRLSFQFTERFPGKFFLARDFAELTAYRQAAELAGIDTILVEQIPGPDTQLCSYYTYLDEELRPQFDLTKRVLRRNPPNMGLGCYHVTDWTPEVRDWGLQLLRSVGLQGLANVEFKWDRRDQTWKLIECNARFTEANPLLVYSGYDLAEFVYNRIVGHPTPTWTAYRQGIRVWYPVEDTYACWLLWRTGQLGFLEWLSSLLHRKHLPLFSWNDPLPSLHGLAHRSRNAVRLWQRRGQENRRAGE